MTTSDVSPAPTVEAHVIIAALSVEGDKAEPRRVHAAIHAPGTIHIVLIAAGEVQCPAVSIAAGNNYRTGVSIAG